MRTGDSHQQALATAIRALCTERQPACLLDTQGTFLFVNEAWDLQGVRLGRSCPGSSLIGTNWLEHVVGDRVKHRHAELLASALAPHRPRGPLLQVCECNTATTATLVSTRFVPVVLGDEQPLAVKVVHTLARSRPIEEVYEVVHRPLEAYRRVDGVVRQCACCGRLGDPVEPGRWDLVPELLGVVPGAEEVLCELCSELHFAESETPG